MTSFVGVDLHRNNFTYCIRENGEEKKIGKCEISELKGFASLLGKDTAMRFLKAHVGRLVVVNPSQFKVISTSTKKTDKHDAKILAEFLEKDMLPEVRMKDDLQAKISSLTQTREKLVQLRTVLKNKVNNLLAANFIVLKREELSTETGLRKALSFHFDPITDTELFVVVEQIRSLNQSIEKLDKAIGSKGAATLLSTIGNIHDFRSSKQLAAYIGIVPRVSNSNDTVCHGRITKNGSKIARTTLVQCALIAKRYSPYLHAFHESVKSRRGGAKANIALARKFLDIVYRTLKNNWMFEDFTQFKLVKN